MKRLTLHSYAKVNFGLLLLGKRRDGYHDIATIFQQIDLHDTLTFSPAKTVQISCSDPEIPADDRNLVFRALDVFRETASTGGEGLHVHIEKRIPAGAGLGGGSSNAAVTLLAANHLWGCGLTDDALREIGLKVGSDVPFFLTGGTALGEGRGERLTPGKWPEDYWVLVLYPGFSVSTAWAYGKVRIALTKEEKFTNFRALFKSYAANELKHFLVNELEDAVFKRHPVLRLHKTRLYEQGAFYAGMSGSGSSVFGLFHLRGRAAAAESFFSIEKGMKTFLCRPVSVSPLHPAAR